MNNVLNEDNIVWGLPNTFSSKESDPRRPLSAGGGARGESRDVGCRTSTVCRDLVSLLAEDTLREGPEDWSKKLDLEVLRAIQDV